MDLHLTAKPLLVCRVTESYEEFESQIIKALKQDAPEEHHRRSELMREETWEKKVEKLCLKIEAVSQTFIA